AARDPAGGRASPTVKQRSPGSPRARAGSCRRRTCPRLERSARRAPSRASLQEMQFGLGAGSRGGLRLSNRARGLALALASPALLLAPIALANPTVDPPPPSSGPSLVYVTQTARSPATVWLSPLQDGATI